MKSSSFLCSVFFLFFALVTNGCLYDKFMPPPPPPLPPSCDTINVTYTATIKPILQQNCYECHSSTATNPQRPGYLFFDNFNELKTIALAQSPASNLRDRINHRGIQPYMPFQRTKLDPCTIRKIEIWIEAGCPNN
ncbi:MAG: hypothetical protein NZ108_06530 [Bacteroidia bacterium]|nr:hypothetical protein [Bacteroidia bacterium]